MKAYNSKVGNPRSLETKRFPLRDYSNVLCTRSRGNVSKTARKVLEEDNSYRHNIQRKKIGNGGHRQIETKQVLDDISRKKCQVFLDIDKSIENKIIKLIGNKTIQKDNKKNVRLSSNATKDIQFKHRPCQVILKRDKSIERNIIKMFGEEIMHNDNQESVCNKTNKDERVNNTNKNGKSKQHRPCKVILKKDKSIERNIMKMFGKKMMHKDNQESVCNKTNKDERVNNTKENGKSKKLRQTTILDVSKKRQKGDFNETLAECKNLKEISVLDSSDNHRYLRKRNSKQNFAEESLNELQEEPKSTKDGNTDKKPVYRRISQFKEPKQKKKKDIYAFDTSLEDVTKSPNKRKRKRGHSLSTSLPFERYMKEMVRKLDEKHGKEMDKKKKGNGRKGNKSKVKTEINNKPKVKKTNQKDKKINEVEIKNLSTEVISSNLAINGKGSVKIPETDKIKIVTNIKIAPMIPKNNGYQKQFASTPLHQRDSSPNNFDSEHNDDFDQLSFNKTPNTNRFRQINTPLSPILDTTNNIEKKNSVEASPWRFNIEVRRNPHYLQYKRSLLPNYNQEMVLDSTLIEKRSFSNSTSDFNVSGPIRKQTSILKYVSGGKNVENFDSMNVYNSTLFDAHDFISPEKRKSLENKENKGIGKNFDCAKRNILKISDNNSMGTNIETKKYPKRNILGPKIDNENNISKINSETEESSLNSSKSEFFGFDASEISHQPNQDTPRRMEDVIKKLLNKKKKFSFVANVTTKNNVSSDIDDDAEKKLEEIGFFDYKDEVPERNFDLDEIKQYKRKRGKRRRSPSRSGTESEGDEDYTRRKRKKKNERTKAEEAAAQKWYKEFNKMCEEVDKFPLEIEKVK